MSNVDCYVFSGCFDISLNYVVVIFQILILGVLVLNSAFERFNLFVLDIILKLKSI